MKNPFQQLPFVITDDYLDISLKGVSKKITCIDFNGNSETRGIAKLLIADRKQFSNNEEALIILLQRFLYEEEEWTDFANFSTDDVRQFTSNFLLPHYGNSEFLSLSIDEFQQSYKEILESEKEFAVKLPGLTHMYPEPWFGIKLNKENVTDLESFDPLQQEEILECFYFKNEWDDKQYFAISRHNYIFFNWALTW